MFKLRGFSKKEEYADKIISSIEDVLFSENREVTRRKNDLEVMPGVVKAIQIQEEEGLVRYSYSKRLLLQMIARIEAFSSYFEDIPSLGYLRLAGIILCERGIPDTGDDHGITREDFEREARETIAALHTSYR